MKKKHIVISLLVLGVGLMILAIILTNQSMKSVSIIGGAAWHTYWTVLTCWHGGLYMNIARVGACFVIASILLALIRKKK